MLFALTIITYYISKKICLYFLMYYFYYIFHLATKTSIYTWSNIGCSTVNICEKKRILRADI